MIEMTPCEKREIRIFARVVPLVLTAWGFISGLFLQTPRWGGKAHWWLFGIAVVLFFWGILSPRTLRPVYRVWSVFSHALGWVLTTLVMFLVYVIGFITIGLILRLFRVDPLNRRLDPQAESYWNPRSEREFDKSHYERQF